MCDHGGRRFAIANREGQAMSFTLIRPAAGLALLAALAAGCGNAVAAQPAAPKPATSAHHHSGPMHTAVTTPPAPATAPAQTANPIPQGNGGDQDADNNGGPSDGDGNI
jgi:hypothetical protein